MLGLSGKGEFLQETWSSLGQCIFVVSASAIVQLAHALDRNSGYHEVGLSREPCLPLEGRLYRRNRFQRR